MKKLTFILCIVLTSLSFSSAYLNRDQAQVDPIRVNEWQENIDTIKTKDEIAFEVAIESFKTAEVTYKNKMYTTARTEIDVAKESLNKLLDETKDTVMIEKIKIRLEQVYSLASKISQKITFYNAIWLDKTLFPYDEIIKEMAGCQPEKVLSEDEWKKFKEEIRYLNTKEFSTEQDVEKYIKYFNNNNDCLQREATSRIGQYRYAKALDLLQSGDLTWSLDEMRNASFGFIRTHRLNYNIAYLYYTLGNDKDAEKLLDSIYAVANIRQEYGQRVSSLPRIIPKVDTLYELIKNRQNGAGRKKEENIKVQQAQSPKTMDPTETQARNVLGEKSVVVEELAKVIKEKDAETQDRVKAILEAFKASKDEYTRSIGIYLSYLLK